MIDYDVPFYSNTPDDTHCFQAALKMILKYFHPDKEYSWEELDKISAKVEGMWTWPYAGLVWLAENGFEVRNIELFDNERFAKEGYPYLVEFYGEERAMANKINSNLDQEQKLAFVFVQKISSEIRMPSIQDILALLEQGYLVGCNVNARTLNGKEGYVGHFVVVKGFEDGVLVVHDPGLPAYENRKITFEDFEKAWTYTSDEAKNIMAFRLK